ncbi:hypothetical protein PSAC2689_80018 [Paraburkholderia sacchari]
MIGFDARFAFVVCSSFCNGRQSYRVVRLGFKPSWGRQPFPGQFDSVCLPPPWLLPFGPPTPISISAS